MTRWIPPAIGAVALILFGVFFGNQVSLSMEDNVRPDFPNYYLGGEHLFDGRPVYGELEDEVQERFGVAGYDAYPADPPPTMVVVAPLSLLPYNTAWLLVAFVSILILVAVVYLTAREMQFDPRWSATLAAVALVTTSFRFLITRNHIESLVLLFGFLGWRALRRRGAESAGVWWGLATALKLFPGVWLMGLFPRRTRVGVVTGSGVVIVLFMVSLAVMGLEDVSYFATDVVGASTRWYGALGNYSLLSLGTALVSTTLGWVLTGLAVLILVPAYLKFAVHPDQVFVAGTAAALLISPLSWLNYLILAIPALVIVGARLDVRQSSDRWWLFGLVASLGFWGPVVFAAKFPTILVSFIPTYGLVALFVFAVTRLRETSPAEMA
jgi:hypothetical protein